MEAYLINGVFTYEFETEIHAEDYEAAIEEFELCFMDQLTQETKAPYFPDHVEIIFADEISKEKLRQRSYHQSKENDL